MRNGFIWRREEGSESAFEIRDGSESGSGFEQQFHGRERSESPPELVIRFAPADR